LIDADMLLAGMKRLIYFASCADAFQCDASITAPVAADMPARL
jgi:hypothetical protein